MVPNWFPDGQEALDRIERIYRKHNPELCDELYLSLIVAYLDKILSDMRPKTATGRFTNPSLLYCTATRWVFRAAITASDSRNCPRYDSYSA
jgi:hypothetical protein